MNTSIADSWRERGRVAADMYSGAERDETPDEFRRGLVRQLGIKNQTIQRWFREGFRERLEAS